MDKESKEYLNWSNKYGILVLPIFFCLVLLPTLSYAMLMPQAKLTYDNMVWWFVPSIFVVLFLGLFMHFGLFELMYKYRKILGMS